MPGRSSARRYGFHPGAGAEFIDELERLVAEDHPLAVRFEAAVTRAIGRILQHPDLGRVIFESEILRLRKWQVQRFRYSLIYMVIGDDIRIYALAHHSRRPGYWLNRIRKP